MNLADQPPTDRIRIAAARLRINAAGAGIGKRWEAFADGQVWAGIAGGRPVTRDTSPATGEHIATVDPATAVRFADLLDRLSVAPGLHPAITSAAIAVADTVLRLPAPTQGVTT